MRKCKNSYKWLEDKDLEPWLKPVSGNDLEVYCSVCQKAINVDLMGINAVWFHMLSASHKATMGHKMQVSIVHFCATPLSLTTAANGFFF